METTDNEVVLDGLPYIDHEYQDPQRRKQVEKLIQEEMKTFRPPDYLKSMPIPTVAGESVIVKDMFERKSAPPKMSFDASRYKITPPKSSNIADWEEALKKAQTQLEHQTARIINLELLKRYGSNKWKGYADQMEEIQQILSKNLGRSKTEIKDINRKRKASQLAVAPQIANAERRYLDYAYTNNELYILCMELEKQVKKLRSLAGR